MRRRLLLTVAVLAVLVLLATGAQADGLTDLAPLTLANLAPAVAPELPAAALAEADPVGDFWREHEVRFAAFKGMNDLASLGVGASIELWQMSEASSVWFDLAPYYDQAPKRIGGLVGLSTEIDGIPILSMLLAPIRKLSGNTLSRTGVGLWDWRNLICYATVDF